MSAGSQIVVAIAGAATTLAVARLLGPTGTAGYAIAQSVVLLLTVLTTLGLEQGIVYYVSGRSWDARSALQTALVLAGAMGATGAAIALAVRLAAPSAFVMLPVWLTAVVVAGVPFSIAWLFTTAIALATDRYEAYVLPPAVQALLVLCLATSGGALFGLDGAVVGMTIASVIVGVGSAVWATRRTPRTIALGVSTPLRSALTFGLKGYAGNALQLVNYRLDLFVLAAVASSAVVGRYAIAVAVTSTLWLLPHSLAAVLFPRVAQLGASGRDAERALVETKSLRFAGLLVGLGVVILALVLEFLVVPVFGEAFRGSVVPGLILLPGAASVGVSTILAAALAGRGRPIYALYAALIATPVTIALYAILIPEFEANGAALASSVSYLLTFALLGRFYRRLTGLHVFRLLRPTRSELSDLIRLPSLVAAWAQGLRQ
jgi:O-antigen/teichoic acid export membrane protein